MRRSKMLLASAVAVAGFAVGGCVVHTGAVVRLGPPVVIAKGHAHHARCGHFKHRGKWYHAANHHHGPKCGHALKGGVWVLVR